VSHEDLSTFMTPYYIRFRMRSVSKEICRENQIKHCEFSNLLPKNEILWKITVDPRQATDKNVVLAHCVLDNYC